MEQMQQGLLRDADYAADGVQGKRRRPSTSAQRQRRLRGLQQGRRRRRSAAGAARRGSAAGAGAGAGAVAAISAAGTRRCLPWRLCSGVAGQSIVQRGVSITGLLARPSGRDESKQQYCLQ